MNWIPRKPHHLRTNPYVTHDAELWNGSHLELYRDGHVEHVGAGGGTLRRIANKEIAEQEFEGQEG
jgi:hypothetical protein